MDTVFFKYLIRRLAMWSALLVVGLGIWLGVHASSEGLARGWKEAVRKEFARQGIPISIGKLTLDPLHGLVARDVRIYQRAPQDPESPPDQFAGDDAPLRVVADISRIDLDVSLAKLLRGQVYINSVHIRDANASVPVDPDAPDGERLEVSGFFSRMLFSEDSIEIQELRGQVFGVVFTVSGELVRHPRLPNEQKPKDSARGWQTMTVVQQDTVRRGIQLFARLKTPKGMPAVLRVRAMADIGHIEEGHFDFSFHAPEAGFDGLHARDITIRGHYDNGLLQAQDIRFTDNGGTFQAEMDFVRASRTLRFNIESHAAMIEKLRQRNWPAGWPALTIEQSPVITLGGNLVFAEKSYEPAGLVTGSFAFGKILADKTSVEYVSANVAYDGTRLFLRDLDLRAGGGELKADVMLEGTVLQTHGKSTVHPETVAPFLPPGYGRNLVAAFECPPDSTTSLGFTVRGDITDKKSWEVDTRFEAAGIRFHGVPIAASKGRWRVLAGGNHVFNDASLTIPAGAPTAVGDARTTASTSGTVEEITLVTPPFGPTIFRGVKFQGWPHTVIAAIVPETLRAVPRFSLDAPATISVDGTLAGRTGPSSDLKLKLSTPGMSRYPVFDKVLPLEGAVVSLHLKDRSAILPSVRATCYGGTVAGDLAFHGLGGATISSNGNLTLERVGYQDLMRLFSDRKDEAKGTLDVTGSFKFKDGTFATMDADGSMRLVNGDLFSIPLFGPLSPLVEAVLPDTGIGYSVASTATGTCKVREGILTTDDFTAMTPAFKMDGHGTINLSTNAVDFNARFNARGLAQVATMLFSYIFEYKCEGTLGAPQWRPLRIPKIPLPKVQLPKIPLPGRKPE